MVNDNDRPMFHSRAVIPVAVTTRRSPLESDKTPHQMPRSARLRRSVEAVLDSLRAALPDLILRSHKNLCSLLSSVRRLYMRQPAETKRGRPASHNREQLLRVGSALREFLSRETRISVPAGINR